jgi:hypothetical protein
LTSFLVSISTVYISTFLSIDCLVNHYTNNIGHYLVRVSLLLGGKK